MTRILDTKLTWRLLTVVIFLAIWQTYAAVVGGLLIPTPGDTGVTLTELVRDHEFWEAVWLSNQCVLIGFPLAIGIGVPLGLLMGRYAWAERFSDVYINLALVTPMAAIIPLMIMALGFGLLPRVLLVILFATPMVIVIGRGGVRQIDTELIEMAESFGAGEREIWRRVLLPGSLPAILTGIRIALGRAITAMVIIELLMVAIGVGGLIIEFRGSFDGAGLYAVVILVVFEALILVGGLRRLETRLIPWASPGLLSNDR